MPIRRITTVSQIDAMLLIHKHSNEPDVAEAAGARKCMHRMS